MPTARKDGHAEMSQRERDILKVVHPVLQGQRTQAEAAELLRIGVRQVRRLQRKLEQGGDQALVHGLRGKPSNHQPGRAFKRAVLAACRKDYPGFGPTFASEKLAQRGLEVCPQALRRWLVEAGLWKRQRRREAHRGRRPRRACFGELVQFDASTHDWLEGRGETLALLALIDDATSRLMSRFYREGTVQTHMGLLWRWLERHGRPAELYTDRHSIFEPQDKGQALPGAETQFGRALREPDVGLIRARSPQAKGRVGRSFGTAQGRWVKELRLAKAKALEKANEVLANLVPAHNRKFAKEAREAADAHRDLGPGHDLASILSLREERTVSNDYVVRYKSRFWQIHKPALPGLRGGKVAVEERLGGTMAILFKGKTLGYSEAAGRACPGGAAPRPPEFGALAADASGEKGPALREEGRAGVQPSGGRSGCAPAEPYPPAGEAANSARPKGCPAQDHPWRKPFKPHK